MADTTTVDPPALPPAAEHPADPRIILGLAYDHWRAFQVVFTGGHEPVEANWDRIVLQARLSPEIRQPFLDAALNAARASYARFQREFTITPKPTTTKP